MDAKLIERWKQGAKRVWRAIQPKTRHLCQPDSGPSAYYLPVVGAAIVLMAWQVVVDSGKVPAVFLPGPEAVADAYVGMFNDAPAQVPTDEDPAVFRPLKSTEAGDSWLASTWDAFSHATIYKATKASVDRIFSALWWACLLGIPLGILLGAFGKIESLFKLFLLPLGSLPISAFLSVFAVFYALTEMDQMKVAFLTFGTVVYTIPMTLDAVRSVDPALIEKAVDLGYRPLAMLRYYVIPAALPRIWQGIRICNRIAWSYVIMAEVYAISTGLGATIANAQRFQNSPKVYASLIHIIMLTLLTELFYAAVPRLTPVLRTAEED